MALAFLEEALIADQTIRTGEFFLYNPEARQEHLEHMVLDSQALQHLEVVEAATGKVEGSILHFLDNCKSPFGKRNLKRWLLSPLINIQKINDRLDAVEDLMANQYETDVFRSKLGKLPDLEKLLAKIYTYSVRHRVKAIYFENVSLQKLKEFRTLLRHFKALDDMVASLRGKRDQFRSPRLRALLTDDCDGGLFPNQIAAVVDEFEGMIVWKKSAGGEEDIPEP